MNIIEQLEKEEIARLGKTIPVFAPGDTILLIRSAQACPLYFRYSAAIIDKPLAIVGATPFGTPGSGGAPPSESTELFASRIS